MLDNIKSIKDLKLFASVLKPYTTLAIASSLTSDEIEIVKDILSVLVMKNIPFKWVIVATSAASLTVTHADQYLKCIRFNSISWDKIISSDKNSKLQQICLLPDEDTVAEINSVFIGLCKFPSSTISVYYPKLE